MNKVSKKEIQNFIKSWSTGAHEVADKVTFWNTILRFLGVPQEQIDNRTFIDYEKSIKLKENEHFDGSIDAYIPSTHVLIEQKSSGVDLSKPESRPNGGHTEKITPYEQARRYDTHLSANERAYFYVLCNFNEFIIYDIRENVDAKPVTIELKDLEKDLNALDFLVNKHKTRIQKEQQISVDAGKLVSKMYDELLDIFSNYPTLDDEKVKHSINELCVRLVFCLYAEDAGLFSNTEAFYDYLKDVAPNQIGLKLKELFEVLNTEDDDRNKKDQFWKDEHPVLEAFPYVNGGLFANMDIFIPPFTQKLKDILLNEASRGFNWKDISPTIFGAVFESTLNPETRRQGGMHYTSVQNIHKVIDPLFLNELKDELKQIKAWKQPKKKQELAKAFQMKLSRLTFFDPACGSGNFLTETYLCLRKLENEALKIQYPNPVLDVGDSDEYIKVSIQQFFGIEINDFAVSVAKTALWIAESQMMEETKDIFYANWDFLPLKTYTRIHEGNAIRMDWNSVIEAYGCHYVLGNPPFVGAKMLTDEQRADMDSIWGCKRGKMDYVSCWYIKAAQYIQGTNIKCAFVSTNSITQGELANSLGQKLLIDYNCKINFAYRTFVWDNDTENKAHVHVVIIGFSLQNDKNKYIYDKDNHKKLATNINQYLLDAPTVIVAEQRNPISHNAPIMVRGSQLIDGGNFLLTPAERDQLVKQNPELKKYVFEYFNAKLFLHQTNTSDKQYCLYLADCPTNIMKNNRFIYDRIKKVKEFRENSRGKSTQKLADTPSEYFIAQRPKAHSIALPVVSSGNRKYIPMKFLTEEVVLTNALFYIDNADLYEFGILESCVHMAWLRTIGGRLKSDYRYATSLVYNTFPWCNIDDKHKQKIQETAQGILDARKKYPDNSLADLYDPLLMPIELQNAHKANDKAILQAYGLPIDASESDIVAHLFKMYKDLTN